MPKINKAFINKAHFNGKVKTYFDSELRGFGLRVLAKSMSYILMYRNEYGKQRFLTIAKTTEITPEEAKKIAAEKLLLIKQGQDPAKDKIANRNAMTVSELCDLYWEQGTRHKKSSTLAIDRGRIDRHIKPLIGNRAVKDLRRSDVQQMYYDIVDGKYARRIKTKSRGLARITGGAGSANRVFGLFSAIMTFAVKREIIEKNPCFGLDKIKTAKIREAIPESRMKILGKILKDEFPKHPLEVSALRLIALTGCRKGEILELTWDEVDFDEQTFRFKDTKTGRQNRAFGKGAMLELQRIKELFHDESEKGYVFPSVKTVGCHLDDIAKYLVCLCAEHSEFGKYTLHQFRHTFATTAAEMRYADTTIAGLLGHAQRGITSRYIHAVDKALIFAADDVSMKIREWLDGETADD